MPYPVGPAAVLAVRICPADVGRRVTLRRRLPHDSRLSDVVGQLLSWTDGLLMVQRRDGRTETVPAADLAAAKVVAPEVSAYDVQRVAEAGWPPERLEMLGEWALRWTLGVTGRANSVRVAGDPGAPLPDALDAVQQWYDRLGTPPLLQLPHPWTHDTALEDLGWRVVRRTLVMTTRTDSLVETCAGSEPPGVRIEQIAEPDDAWLAMLADEPPQSWEVYRQILGRPARRVFLTAHGPDGELLAVGRASAAALPGGRARWAGLTSIQTAPSARRRGVGRAVVGGLAAWARQHGCAVTYLQVLAANTVARAMYDRLGFREHHYYVYRSPHRPGQEPVATVGTAGSGA